MKQLKFFKMAHKKGVGSSKNGRESESKRLGKTCENFWWPNRPCWKYYNPSKGTAHNAGKMFTSVKTILCMPRLTELLHSQKEKQQIFCICYTF